MSHSEKLYGRVPAQPFGGPAQCLHIGQMAALTVHTENVAAGQGAETSDIDLEADLRELVSR